MSQHRINKVNVLAQVEIFLQYDFFLIIFDLWKFDHKLLVLSISGFLVNIKSMNFQVLQLSLKLVIQMQFLEPVLPKPD